MRAANITAFKAIFSVIALAAFASVGAAQSSLSPKPETLSFTGNTPVWHDSLNFIYQEPHWVDAGGCDGSAAESGDLRFPVAYKTSAPWLAPADQTDDRVQVASVWFCGIQLSDFPLGTVIDVIGTGPNGEVFSKSGYLGASFAFATFLTSDTPIAHVPRFYNPYRIDWVIEVSEPNTPSYFIQAGATENRMYVYFKDVNVANAKMSESLFELSCKGADSEVTKAGITEGVWGEFEGNDVSRKAMGGLNGNDQAPLLYWGPGADLAIQLDPLAGTTVDRLIVGLWGRCGAWAKLLRECLTLQGLEADGTRVGVSPGAAGSQLPETQMIIKSVSVPLAPNPLIPSGFYGRKVYNWFAVDLTDNGLIEGQNNTSPRKSFNAHCIYSSSVTAKLYDPSYGLSAGNEQKWQDVALELIGLEFQVGAWVYRMPEPAWVYNLEFPPQSDP